MQKIEELSYEQALSAMAEEVADQLAETGALKNSFRNYRIASCFLQEAINAELRLKQQFIGNGGFTLKEIIATDWAKRWDIVSPETDYPRSVIKTSAAHTLSALMKSGAIVRKGFSYYLGDLRNVLARS